MAVERVPTTLRDCFFKDDHFAVNWENFDKLKEHVHTVSEDMWKKFNAQLRHYQPMIESENKEDEKAVAPFPRHWMLPSFPALFDNVDSLDLYKEADKELIRFKEDDTSMELSLDTHNYRPDEIHIAVEEGMIVVTGKHEEKSEDGRRTTTRQFRRAYTLPAGVSKEQVTSNLSSDGVLVISAKKDAPAIKN
eukprot:TRINITY_DN3223_c0_g1_i2.p1 TRINITY_DN3223_c0_g1~~TRINITY_DN3223_c0_g1_i2.p1  ORF type:complete len:192 (-),score=79.95 TRINITY_DN3223_c0_g1_i2:116-691(-)